LGGLDVCGGNGDCFARFYATPGHATGRHTHLCCESLSGPNFTAKKPSHALPTSRESPWNIGSNWVVFEAMGKREPGQSKGDGGRRQDATRCKYDDPFERHSHRSEDSVCQILAALVSCCKLTALICPTHGLARDPLPGCTRAYLLQMVHTMLHIYSITGHLPVSGRLNTKLELNGYPPMSSLVKDLSDGVRLIQLMVRAGA
jgi:hypothetical protein